MSPTTFGYALEINIIHTTDKSSFQTVLYIIVPLSDEYSLSEVIQTNEPFIQQFNIDKKKITHNERKYQIEQKERKINE